MSNNESAKKDECFGKDNRICVNLYKVRVR